MKRPPTKKLFACLSGSQAFIIFIMQFFFSATNAQIIYTNVNPDAKFSCAKAGCSHQYNLDLNSDGINDFTITVSKYSASAWCGNNTYNLSVSIATLDSNGVVATNPLLINAVINDQSLYATSSTLESYFVYPNPRGGCYSELSGGWSSSADGYLGLKLIKGGKTYYGWARLLVSVSSRSASFTIKDYAYNSVPDQPILAGQSTNLNVAANNLKSSNTIITNRQNTKIGIIVVPNPVQNSLRVNALSGETLTGKSATATINIYSAAMQLVQTIKVIQVDRNFVTIPVSKLAAGIYFLQLVNTDKISIVKFVKE